MATAEIVSYGMIFAITLVLSLMAIARFLENNKKIDIDWMLPVISSFSWICWFTLIPLHLAFVGEASAFLDAPAILYFAFAVLFVVLTGYSVFCNLQASTMYKERVDQV